MRPRYGFQLCETYQGHLPKRAVAEEKYDGFLMMAQDGRLLSRQGHDMTLTFPEIEPVRGAVVLGELCVFDAQGRATFEGMLRRKTSSDLRIRYWSRELPATFVAFDVLELAGQPLVERPQAQRMAELGKLALPERHALPKRWPVGSDAEVRQLLDRVSDEGLEGLIIKDLDARYHGNRSRAWLKAKLWEFAELPIDSWEETERGATVVHVTVDGHDQTVVVADPRKASKVREGATMVRVRYFSKSPEGLRQPTVKEVW